MPTRLWGDAQRARYGHFPDACGELRPLRDPSFRIGLSQRLMSAHRPSRTHGPFSWAWPAWVCVAPRP